MCPTVEVSKTTYEKLQALAGRLFSPAEVIDRLVASHGDIMPSTFPVPPKPISTGRVAARAARERGATIKIAGHTINAVSVRDLFDQALRHLVDKGYLAKAEPSIPYRTSNQRYLIARKPVHPNANPFVIPVHYKGYFMEAHKNYENALSGLRQISKMVGVPFEYIS